jgi:Zn finger protein HypA/HybF involved in hydrogenase expression
MAETPLKPYRGPPMTLGNAAAAHVRLIVWCRDCHHRIEPDPTEMAARYGAEMTVPDWRERLMCGQCGSRNVDMVVSGPERRPLDD